SSLPMHWPGRSNHRGCTAIDSAVSASTAAASRASSRRTSISACVDATQNSSLTERTEIALRRLAQALIEGCERCFHRAGKPQVGGVVRAERISLCQIHDSPDICPVEPVSQLQVGLQSESRTFGMPCCRLLRDD